MTQTTDLRIAIVGAGLGGIAVAVYLKRSGFSNFIIFERASGPGGVWQANRYPGAAVDVPSEMYSYSFMRYEWPRSHATQQELVAYIDAVIDRFGIRPHLKLNLGVRIARWDARHNTWQVEDEHGAQYEFDVLVPAVGVFHTPRWPEWAEGRIYHGQVVHTAHWDPELHLDGKDVALIGTGSTGCQLAPEIAKVARSLTIYQREPGWIRPKVVREYDTAEAKKRARLLRAKWVRFNLFRAYAERRRDRRPGTKEHAELTRTCLDFIERTIDDPTLRAMVTPSYPVGCKRIVRDSSFYPTLNLPHVDLVPKDVVDLGELGPIDASGVERFADVVVLATGFEGVSNYLRTVDVENGEGVLLTDFWAGEPYAYLGMFVPTFPNMAIMFGPNTSGNGSIIFQHEQQAKVLVSVLKRMKRREALTFEVDERVAIRYREWIDRKNEIWWAALLAGCHNYFLTPSGRIATQWPLGPMQYLIATKVGRHFGMRYR